MCIWSFLSLLLNLLVSDLCAATPSRLLQTEDAPTVGEDGADSSCPCLENRGKLGPAIQGSITVPSGAEYGTRKCSAWDLTAGLHDSCSAGKDMPRWCSMSWCYVNASACESKMEKSGLFENSFFSYHTCGNVLEMMPGIDWAHPDAAISLQRRIYAYAHGLYVSPLPPQSPAIQRALLAFAYHLLVQMGINPRNVTYRELSDASKARSNSSYTACVHDVALGYMDMCVAGGWWDTVDRRAMGVRFPGAVFVDDMYFVAFKKTEDWLTAMARPFLPFSLGLWGLILAILVASALGMAFFEGRFGEFADHPVLHKVWLGLYHAFLSLVSASPSNAPITLSGRLLSVGFGAVVLVVLTSFTANSAYFLVAEHLQTEDRLEDFIRAGKKICFAPGLAASFNKMFEDIDGLSDLQVHVDTLGAEVPEYMAAGRCQGGLMSYWLIHEHWGKRAFCNLSIVGQRAIMSLPSGYYVSDSLGTVASWALAAKKADGTWRQMEKDFLPQDKCDDHEDAQEMQMQASHLSGLVIWFVCLFVLALVVRVCEAPEVTKEVERRVKDLDTIARKLSVRSNESGHSNEGVLAADAKEEELVAAEPRSKNEIPLAAPETAKKEPLQESDVVQELRELINEMRRDQHRL